MGEYLFRIAGENRLTTNNYKIGGFLSSSLGGFTGRYTLLFILIIIIFLQIDIQ